MRISDWSSDVCSSDLFVTTLGLRFQKEIPMAVSDTYVRARIDNTTKERATAALGAMGLSISDAIRLLMLRIADERRLPFEVKVPNAATRERSEEHTSELQSLMRITSDVFCLKKNTTESAST